MESDHPLRALAALSEEYSATLELLSDNEAAVDITITMPGDRLQQYLLLFKANGDRVSAEERAPNRLPIHCVERHINHDSTFCLAWQGDCATSVTDIESARAWWTRLVRFLHLQEAASKLRRWPAPANARAHGDAAIFQAEAERLALVLGQQFALSLRNGKLSVDHDQRKFNPRVELYRENKRIARIFLKTMDLVTLATPCPCDDSMAVPTPIGACGNHAQSLAAFILAQYRWMTLEKQFIEDLITSGTRCCGTLTACPLPSSHPMRTVDMKGHHDE
ncbi:MAG: E2 domain-containing protein [Arenimonas sp.]